MHFWLPASLLLSLAIGLAPFSCFAEIYKCGETWQNVSCGDDAQPADLPKITRAQVVTPRYGMRPDLKHTQSNERAHPLECKKVDGTAADVRIMEAESLVYKADTSESTSLKGSISNLSDVRVRDPIYILWRAEGRESHIRSIKIAEGLIPRQSMRFSVNALHTSHAPFYRGDYYLQVSYKPASRCEWKRISTTSSVVSRGIFGSTESRFFDGTGSQYEDEILATLKEIRREAKYIRRRFRLADKQHNSEFNAAMTRARARLNSTCARARQLPSTSSTIVSRCLELANLLQQVSR